MSSVDKIISDLVQLQYNPSAIQDKVLDMVEEMTSKELTVVDPTNPFVYVLEMASCLAVANDIKAEALNRKQYPTAAQTDSELYLHMSDRDYLNRFATPGRAKISILFLEQEILDKMVPDPDNSISKIVIPRNTYFEVAGMTFAIEYPVEIRKLVHGGLQVVYDGSVESPIYPLETNLISHDIRVDNNNKRYIHFTLDVYQFSVTTKTESITSSTEVKLQTQVSDQYFYTRAFYQDPITRKWIEMYTTHSDQVYDIRKPTMVLRLEKDTLISYIPQIYTNNQLIPNTKVRLDIYQTKGAINVLLNEYPSEGFVARWEAYDQNDLGKYTAPLNTIQTSVFYSDASATGGSFGMKFSTLQEKVVKNALGQGSTPITNVQIETVLEKRGYDVIKNIDNITNRVFLASRNLPFPNNSKLISPANSNIETLNISMKGAVDTGLVINNGDSVTIKSNTLFNINNGILSFTSSNVLNYMKGLSPSGLASFLNLGNYVYTPFHYVLDASGIEFDLRAYYLDEPTTISKNFKSANQTTLLEVGTKYYEIRKNDAGYILRISTISSDAFIALDDSNIHVQLAFTSEGEQERSYLNGTLISKGQNGERTYEFVITTNYHIVADAITLLPFAYHTNQATPTACKLTTDFDIIYSVTSPAPSIWKPSVIDQIIGRQLLPPNAIGVTHESLKVRFGHYLKNLWSRSRSVVGAQKYETYANDIPLTYDSDVYKKVNGSEILFDPQGNAYTEIIHPKGSPVLNPDNSPVYKYRKGDVIKDVNGFPIPIGSREIVRQVDIMLIEGGYLLANDSVIETYRKEMTKNVVDWIMNDFTDISARLLEQTRVYFHPTASLGSIRVLVENSVEKTIDAAQSFKVNVYLNKTNHADTELREKITQKTIITINEALKSNVVSLDKLDEDLRSIYGDSVISVKTEGLANDSNINIITVMDQGARCSIRKRISPLPDNKLIVEEDVTMNFIKHEKD